MTKRRMPLTVPATPATPTMATVTATVPKALLIVLTVLLLSITATNQLSAQCGEQGNAPCDPPYRQVLTEQPDWCQYQSGDGVYLKFDPNVAQAPIEGYYIVPIGDYTSQPPDGFYPFRFYVYSNAPNCGWSIF